MESIAQSVAKAGAEGTVKVSDCMVAWMQSVRLFLAQYHLCRPNILNQIADMRKYGAQGKYILEIHIDAVVNKIR